MRNMSFAMTTKQIQARTKTVTRRLGWGYLKAGDLIQAVEKAQGLRKGENVQPLAVLRIVDVRREPLNQLTRDLEYGIAECIKEGFGKSNLQYPSVFVEYFCAANRPCEKDWTVTRIEFEYVESAAQAEPEHP